MNLEDISEEYQKNLVEFFNNDDVIDHIYKEQYGEENYKLHKDEYQKQYKEIIENTVFVPYITLDNLESFLAVNQKKYGQKYVQEKYSEELKLCVRLNKKKKDIIEKYTQLLIEDIKSVDRNFNIDKKSLSNTNFYINLKLLSDNVKSNSVSYFFKKKKLNKLFDKYMEAVNDKIITETTSYYKHKRDCSEDKYYTSMLDGIKDDGSFVKQKIGKIQEKNCRYIFLPIMKYRNTKDYLTFAIHEVMHISKEKLSKDNYRSGLLTRKIPSNKMSSSLYVTDTNGDNLIQSIRWMIFKIKNHKKIKGESLYTTGIGDSQMEESMHHWQVRKVVDALINDGLDKSLYSPYCLNLEGRTKLSYENADKVTKKFMENFESDIRKINSGEETVKDFKKKVGYTNYGLLRTAYQAIDGSNISKKAIKSAATLSKMLYSSDSHKLYESIELGEKIVKRMEDKAETYSKRKSKSKAFMNTKVVVNVEER